MYAINFQEVCRSEYAYWNTQQYTLCLYRYQYIMINTYNLYMYIAGSWVYKDTNVHDTSFGFKVRLVFFSIAQSANWKLSSTSYSFANIDY